MHEFFEEISQQLEAKNAFVVYRKPNTTLVKGLFQNDDKLHYVNDFTERGFVFSPFDGLDKTILINAEKEIQAEQNFDVPKEEQGFQSNEFSKPEAEEFHISLVKKGIAAINSSNLEKIVLSRKREVDCKKSPIQLFKKLLETYTNALCYLWFHPKVGMWLGATPELLLKTENNRLRTSSLAATQVFTGDSAPKWGVKEIEEQQLVTNFIAGALQDKVANLQIGEVKTIRTGNLLHLQTLINGTMQNNLTSIISALHPTPATCGLPKEEAQQFILENEDYDRKFYTGFLGELNFKEENFRSKTRKNTENRAYSTIKTVSHLFANLRCAEINGSKATIFIGGGITSLSDPEKEWEETVSKSNTMLRILLK